MFFNISSSSLKLSVLDQSVATSDQSHETTLQNTLELAGFCEELGYNRFWVSEHHNHPTILGTAPEILMGAIAARTRKIRIGSAGYNVATLCFPEGGGTIQGIGCIGSGADRPWCWTCSRKRSIDSETTQSQSLCLGRVSPK